MADGDKNDSGEIDEQEIRLPSPRSLEDDLLLENDGQEGTSTSHSSFVSVDNGDAGQPEERPPSRRGHVPIDIGGAGEQEERPERPLSRRGFYPIDTGEAGEPDERPPSRRSFPPIDMGEAGVLEESPPSCWFFGSIEDQIPHSSRRSSAPYDIGDQMPHSSRRSFAPYDIGDQMPHSSRRSSAPIDIDQMPHSSRRSSAPYDIGDQMPHSSRRPFARYDIGDQMPHSSRRPFAPYDIEEREERPPSRRSYAPYSMGDQAERPPSRRSYARNQIGDYQEERPPSRRSLAPVQLEELEERPPSHRSFAPNTSVVLRPRSQSVSSCPADPSEEFFHKRAKMTLLPGERLPVYVYKKEREHRARRKLSVGQRLKRWMSMGDVPLKQYPFLKASPVAYAGAEDPFSSSSELNLIPPEDWKPPPVDVDLFRLRRRNRMAQQRSHHPIPPRPQYRPFVPLDYNDDVNDDDELTPADREFYMMLGIVVTIIILLFAVFRPDD